MKKIVFLFLVLPFLLSTYCDKEPESGPCGKSPPCGNDPNIVCIPDACFFDELIRSGVDQDGDGIISTAEAEAITYLDVSTRLISDMTGIEAFDNLDTLKCFYIPIKGYDHGSLVSLDVSNNTKLIYLHCQNNQLTDLDVSNNTALKYLHITNMSTLYEVCVWTIPFPPDGVEVETLYSPNVYYTTDCSK